MGKRGEHVITSDTSGTTPEGESRRYWRGCLDTSGTTSKSEGWEYLTFLAQLIAFLVLLSTPIILIDARLNPAPSLPHKPQPRVAIFEAANPNGTNFSVILGGGNYDIHYESASNLENLEVGPNEKVFTADFNKNETTGDLKLATTVILIGTLRLDVGDIAGEDSLYASILARGKNLNAYFNFATSPTGPPIIHTDREKKRAIIVGTLNKINLGSTYDNSTQTLRVLDLNPSEEAEREYRKAYERYQREIEKYRSEQKLRRYTPKPHYR
jgi:hypothetical protein